MDTKLVEQFLFKVVNDPYFRKTLQENPVETLAKIGVKINPAMVPAGGVQLPEPEVIVKLWLTVLLRNNEVGLSDHTDLLFK
jgi:hypothetical protein